MTLRELHARLGEMVEANERRGRSGDNDLPTVVRIQRGRYDWWVPVDKVWIGLISLDGDTFSGEILTREAELIKAGRRK